LQIGVEIDESGDAHDSIEGAHSIKRFGHEFASFEYCNSDHLTAYSGGWDKYDSAIILFRNGKSPER
jgi:hypothetical protein